MSLKIKPAKECRWDQLSLGEVMLRLDPGEGRIHTTRQFQVWEGVGHFLMMEKPREFNEALAAFLAKNGLLKK